jgi:hypothetical protein
MSTKLAWFKSSYSNPEGESCVELAWARSSYSNNEGESCVAATPTTAVHVRDSKDPDGSPILTFTPNAWADFIKSTQAS